MSERLHIITAAEAKELARPLSAHVDTNEIDAYIAKTYTDILSRTVVYREDTMEKIKREKNSNGDCL